MSDTIKVKDIQEFIEEEGFYTFKEYHFKLNGSKIEIEEVHEAITSYSEGCVGSEHVFKIGDKYFKIIDYYNSWDGGENSIAEVRISGYKQVPIFENISEERDL